MQIYETNLKIEKEIKKLEKTRGNESAQPVKRPTAHLG
jgi:hypothetical protein